MVPVYSSLQFETHTMEVEEQCGERKQQIQLTAFYHNKEFMVVNQRQGDRATYRKTEGEETAFSL